MARSTTPTQISSDFVVPNTPHSDIKHSMPVPRNTPIPSTPSHRRIASTPRTPGTSPLTACSSSPSAFTAVKVHTAKCSECDKRNMDVMLRCPGCTFQVCKPCQEKREKAGRSLTHGNMLSPHVATPATGGSVVRRRPVGVLNSNEKESGKEQITRQGVEEKEQEQMKGEKPPLKPATMPEVRSKTKMRAVTPSDDSTGDSSDDDFAPDPVSPTSNKRRRTEPTGLNCSNIPTVSSSSNSSLISLPIPNDLLQAPSANVSEALPTGRTLSDMSMDEILAHYNVNTSANPYKAHLLSRHEPVVFNPVIQIPEMVKRGFKPRPSAKEIQQNIKEKVREKMGLPAPVGTTDEVVDEDVVKKLNKPVGVHA